MNKITKTFCNCCCVAHRLRSCSIEVPLLNLDIFCFSSSASLKKNITSSKIVSAVVEANCNKILFVLKVNCMCHFVTKSYRVIRKLWKFQENSNISPFLGNRTRIKIEQNTSQFSSHLGKYKITK